MITNKVLYCVARQRDFPHPIDMANTIGFVGLGIMGQGMALNLVRAGYTLHVWNRTQQKTEPLVAAGARAVGSPAEVAANSEIVVVCVSDTADVQQVMLGHNGIAAGAAAGSLVIDCSTISPSATREIAATLAAKDIAMLDAPVSGGSEGAAAGTLSIMVGGEPEPFERAAGVFAAMGATITHVGPIGAGQTVKLVNQVLVVGNALAMSEALLLAQAGGVDLEKTYQAVSKGAAGSWMFTNRGPQIMARDWRPGFTVDLQLKDLRLVMEYADQLGIPLPGTAMVFQLYRTLQSQGLGAEGNHALVKALEQLSGVAVGATDQTSA